MAGNLDAAANAAEAALAGTGTPSEGALPAADAGGQAPHSGAAPVAPQTTPPSSPSSSGQPAGSTAQATTTEEPKFEIKVDGKTELLTRAEIIARAQMGTAFTQKTQRLAEERRRFETDRQTILEQEKQRWLQEQQEQARRAQEVGKTPGELAMLRTQQLEQRLEDQALTMSVDVVVSKHAGLDRNDFMMECVKRGLRDSNDVNTHGAAVAAEMESARNSSFDNRFNELLTKGEHPSLKAYKEAVIAEYLKSKGGGPSPVTSAGGATPSLGGSPKRAKTLDEAADIAAEMLGATGR